MVKPVDEEIEDVLRAYPGESRFSLDVTQLIDWRDWTARLRAENAELWRTCPTIPMSPAPEFGYDPIPLILSGEKTHTLRGQSRLPGSFAEVTVNSKRTGIILRFTGSELMQPEEYLTDEFARADGIRPIRRARAAATEGYLMRRLFEGFYPKWKDVPCADWPTRYCLHFEVYGRPEADTDGE